MEIIVTLIVQDVQKMVALMKTEHVLIIIVPENFLILECVINPAEIIVKGKENAIYSLGNALVAKEINGVLIA